MVRFWVGRSGRGGAGWIGGVYFDEPKFYETDDPAMIEALRNSGVAREVQDEIAAEADTPAVEDMKHADLKELCQTLGLPISRSKSDMIATLQTYWESDNEVNTNEYGEQGQEPKDI